MILETNTTERKQLAHALAVHLGTDAVYLGPPSFAYKVGAVLIRRDGALEGDDLEVLKPFLTERGFLDEEATRDDEELDVEMEQPEVIQAMLALEASEQTEDLEAQEDIESSESTEDAEDLDAQEDTEASEPTEATEDLEAQEDIEASEPTEDAEDLDVQEDSEASELTEATEDLEADEDDEVLPKYLEVGLPAECITVIQMCNLINMLYSKQYLLGRSIGEQTIQISDTVVNQLQTGFSGTKEDFICLMDDFKASGDLQGVMFGAQSVSLTFPFRKERTPDHDAYLLLASSILTAAKEAQRVKVELQQPENEKYYMRGWLLRLGLGGQDFKALRKRLMRDLKGHCAFATEDEARKHREKYAELRKAERETRKDEGHDAEQ